ncbi:bcl-2-binding component 3 [Archocentrus centrarchus]|uniref:bcl-2-binding component 3 n=1 Tax=Archocentrus centrarchus TaxID=63155 RepID=UPI0011E9D9D9|nr:uncharacterized protein LOC115789964 [Archocentrus centrarchus]
MDTCYRQIHTCTQRRRGPSDNRHQAPTEMARAQTVQSAGETPAGGNSSLPCHNTCRVELPCPLHTWPGMLTSTTTSTSTSTSLSSSGTGTGAIHIHHHHHHHHHLQPVQALYLSYPLPYSHPEDQGEPRNHQQLPAASPSSPGGRLSGEQSGSGRRAYQRASGRQRPRNNMLPQNEQPPWASPHHRVPGGDAEQELQIRRVANQLRAIGDELNATLLRRAHVGPQWQDFRDICRGLLSFITQTLSTLYRLT